jgi:hypothetical protein
MKKYLYLALAAAVLGLTACNSETPVTGISLSQQEMELLPGESKTLTATVLPSDADNPAVTWTSSDVRIATVEQSGQVTAVAVGTCTVTCSSVDGSGVTAECTVTVTHEYVDLGLPSGTLWAICNIGAEKPEDYGSYFAWGETQPKEYYDWSTYKYSNGMDGDDKYGLITKYCVNSENGYNGFMDGLTELLPEDDAATVNWGKNWRMPSNEQMQELCDNTTTEWTTQNGVAGRRIMSKSNGNSIFLPARGIVERANYGTDAGRGAYWSRSLSTRYSYDACTLSFSSSQIRCKDQKNDRSDGRLIRPVRVQN